MLANNGVGQGFGGDLRALLHPLGQVNQPHFLGVNGVDISFQLQGNKASDFAAQVVFFIFLLFLFRSFYTHGSFQY